LTISGGTVDFGPAEGLLNQNNANIVVNSTLSGTGGLTATNTTAGTITLNAADIYTGTTTANALPATTATTSTTGNASALGNGPVTLTSGQIATSVTVVGIGSGSGQSTFGLFALSNPVNFNNSVVTFANSVNRIDLTGPISLSGNNQIAANATTFGAT